MAASKRTLDSDAGRRVYVHLVRGELAVNGTVLSGGDALKLTDVDALSLAQGRDAEVLVFDLPGEQQAVR